MKFYRCDICGNLVEVIEESNKPMSCCWKNMTELIPGKVDASKEKHVPVIKKDGNKVCVTVGSDLHPMTSEHYISWIVIETILGTQRRTLTPWDTPKAEFLLDGKDSLIAVYAYCNKHGLWMAKP